MNSIKIQYYLIILFFLILNACAGSKFKAGNEYLSQGILHKALFSYYDESLQKNDYQAISYLKIAKTYAKLNRYEKSLDYYNKAINTATSNKNAIKSQFVITEAKADINKTIKSIYEGLEYEDEILKMTILSKSKYYAKPQNDADVMGKSNEEEQIFIVGSIQNGEWYEDYNSNKWFYLSSVKNIKSYSSNKKLSHLDCYNNYKRFLSNYKHVKYKNKVIKKMDFHLYENSKLQDTIKAYKNYIKTFPNGIFKQNSEERIEELFFDKIRNEDNSNFSFENRIQAYRTYLKKYSKGRFVSKAQERIKELTEDLDYSDALKTNTIKSFQSFIAKYPNSQYLEDSLINIDKIIYEPYKTKNSIALYKEYIQAYPNGRFVKDAHNAINRLTFLKNKKHITSRYTFNYGRVGKVYLPKIEDYHPDSETYFVNGKQVTVSKPGKTTSYGGHKVDSYGYNALYELKNNSNSFFIVKAKLSTILSEEYYEREEYCAQRIIFCLDYKYKNVRYVRHNPLSVNRTYKLAPQQSVKDYLTVGVEEPNNLDIEVVEIIEIDSDWLLSKKSAIENQSIKELEIAANNVNSKFWKSELSSAYKKAMYTKYHKQLISSKIQFSDDYDPDFKSSLTVVFKNNDNNIIELIYELPFSSKTTISLKPGETKKCYFTIKGYPKHKVSLKVWSYLVKNSFMYKFINYN